MNPLNNESTEKQKKLVAIINQRPNISAIVPSSTFLNLVFKALTHIVTVNKRFSQPPENYLGVYPLTDYRLRLAKQETLRVTDAHRSHLMELLFLLDTFGDE